MEHEDLVRDRRYACGHFVTFSQLSIRNKRSIEKAPDVIPRICKIYMTFPNVCLVKLLTIGSSLRPTHVQYSAFESLAKSRTLLDVGDDEGGGVRSSIGY